MGGRGRGPIPRGTQAPVTCRTERISCWLARCQTPSVPSGERLSSAQQTGQGLQSFGQRAAPDFSGLHAAELTCTPVGFEFENGPFRGLRLVWRPFRRELPRVRILLTFSPDVPTTWKDTWRILTGRGQLQDLSPRGPRRRPREPRRNEPGRPPREDRRAPIRAIRAPSREPSGAPGARWGQVPPRSPVPGRF